MSPETSAASIGNIKNWHKFQHFKDRRPPWIKLYRDILDDKEWFALEGNSAKALVMLWLIASEDDGRLPDIETIAFRLRISTDKCKSLIANLKHWIDAEMISTCHQGDTPETETETETETDFCAFWEAYPRKVGKKAAAKAWHNAKDKPTLDTILAAVRRQAQSDQWRKDGGQFVPHPSTWLNQGRWADGGTTSNDADDFAFMRQQGGAK